MKTAVTELYARHVNLGAEDKTVPSDTRPAVSDAEMEKEFGRQVHACNKLFPCICSSAVFCWSCEASELSLGALRPIDPLTIPLTMPHLFAPPTPLHCVLSWCVGSEGTLRRAWTR